MDAPSVVGSWSRDRRWVPAGAGALAGLALVVLLAGCGGGTAPPATSAAVHAAAPADVEERALLLLLADRRQLEPTVVARAQRGDAALRERLAATLGQVGDPAALSTLELLLFDPEPAVRRAAAFAVGEIADPVGAGALLRAASDPDHEVGVLAVEALGKLEVAVAEVVAALAVPRPGSLAAAAPAADEAQARLLPHLFRFREDAMVPIAEHGLLVADPGLAARAAYALTREPRPAGLAAVRGLLDASVATGDPAAPAIAADPVHGAWVRGLAARALGIAGSGEDLDRLRRLFDDPAPGPIIQALRAAARLVADGKATAPPAWSERLRALLDDDRPGVRLTALEAAAYWLVDAAIGEEVARRAVAAAGRERELALEALVVGLHPAAADGVLAAAASQDAVLRARAATLAGAERLDGAPGLDKVLGRLAADAVAGVRVAALGARLERCARAREAAAGPVAVGDCAELVRAALADADPVVRAAALDWTAQQPVLALEELEAAYRRALADRDLPDARLSAVDALAARAKAQPLERGGAIAALEATAADADAAVRRRAVDALAGMGQPRRAVGPVDTGRSLVAYRGIAAQTVEPRWVALETTRGTLRLRLACPEAPMTCLNFLQLARAGYFDGQTFHRVVPDFVVQGGDPRGDGSGGPGYAIRDEINRLRYGRGALGMALSGPDTGGSQFFLTLAPQPHLDGGYTVFGQLDGDDGTLDRIVQGDRIVAVREIAPPAASDRPLQPFSPGPRTSR